MNYPRFTKVIIDYFMTRKLSISRRNRIHWHYVRDDALFSTIKVVELLWKSSDDEDVGSHEEEKSDESDDAHDDDDDDEDDNDDDEEEKLAKNDDEDKETGKGGDEVRESEGKSEEE
nr:hypothetical protein [Tanacetum cinerariifolium]